MADDGSQSPIPGRYRLWSGVSLHGRLLYSTRPLAVTRLNVAAVEVIDALTQEFQSSRVVSRVTDRDTESVARLLEGLHRRGFLEWEPASDTTFVPPVSVVVTVRNDRDHLQGCLDALAELDYSDFEVVVVDDGSTDGTVSMARTHPFVDRGHLTVESVGSPADPLGIGASRNHGVSVAQHDIIAFTDADCRPRSDWLTELVPCLAEHDLIGGRVKPHGERPVDRYENVNSSLDMGDYATRLDPDGATPYLPTANLVGRRGVFEAVPFPERNIAEDVDVCWRAIDHGFDVVYTPTGVVEHDYRANLREFSARRTDYGASEALLARTHGHGGRVTLPLEPIVLLVVFAVGVASGLSSITLFMLAAVGAIGLLGLVGGRILRRHCSLRAVVPVAAVLRSYGRGVLSTGYAVSKELMRYYGLPLAVAGVVLTAVWPAIGVGVLGTVVVSIAMPAVVEYAIHRPGISVRQYLGLYLADHFGYQRGVYRGIAEYHTVAHLSPAKRFRPTGPLAAVLGTLAARMATDSDIETISIGGYTARFRVTTSAERWWFESDDLRGERQLITTLLDEVRADDVVFDIGANIGLYTCFLPQAVLAGEVIAFEPHSTNNERLTENVALNGVDVQLSSLALGDTNTNGLLRTNTDEAGVGDHSLAPSTRSAITSVPIDSEPTRVLNAVPKYAGESSFSGPSELTEADSETVRVAAGDSLVEQGGLPRPTVLKIDVEGAELAVLRGLERTLFAPACRVVYCEIHPEVLAERGTHPADVERFLEQRGFVCESFEHAGDREFLFARASGSRK